MASERTGAAEGAKHGLGVVAFAIDLANDGRELTRRQIAHRLDHIQTGGRIGVISCRNRTIEHRTCLRMTEDPEGRRRAPPRPSLYAKLTSRLTTVMPRATALAWMPTARHEPSAASEASDGLGAVSSPSSPGGSSTT